MTHHPTQRRTLASLTPEQREQLAARYPHESTLALAAEFVLAVRQISNWAYENGLHKTATGRSLSRRPDDSLTAHVERIVLAAGPAGLDAEQLREAVQAAHRGHSAHQIRVARCKLVDALRIHRGTDPTTHALRWYGSPEWAQRASHRHVVTSTPTAAEQRTPTAAEQRAATQSHGHDRRRHRAADAAAALRAHRQATAHINLDGIPVTHCPGAPESRWANLTVTDGAFSTRRPGQYLDDQPKPWAQAATRQSDKPSHITTTPTTTTTP